MDPRGDGLGQDISWLPAETFEVALDSAKGAVSSPGEGDSLLTVTSHRVVRSSGSAGKRTTSIMPLRDITAIDVIDVSRPTERLSQGVIILAVGLVLGWVSWTIISVALVSLVVGGLPVLAAVYLLSSWAFPDVEGEIIVHSGGYQLRHPLSTSDARRDAYLVAQHVFELSAVLAEPVAAPVSAPAAPSVAPAVSGSPSPAINEQEKAAEETTKAEPSVRITDAGPPPRPKPAVIRPWLPNKRFFPTRRR